MKKRPPGHIDPTASDGVCSGLGGWQGWRGGGCWVMNKDTKDPTDKDPPCRKPAVPTVGNFGKTKVNEREKNGDGDPQG